MSDPQRRTMTTVKWTIGGMALLFLLAYAAFCGWALDSGGLPPKPPAMYTMPCGVLFIVVLVWLSPRGMRYP